MPLSLGVGAQVAVVLPRRDRGDADVRRVDLHQRHCAVLGHGRGEAGLERLKPSAVVDNQPGLIAVVVVNAVTPAYESGPQSGTPPT
jgi:hypothetical protein